MADGTITLDQVDAAFRHFDADRYQSTITRFSAADVQQNPSAVLGAVCPVYTAVRPFLKLAAGLPFLPQAWKTGIEVFINAMDLICPNHG
jgi:hypothetical protein